MIVSLAEIKPVLGIALDDVSEDANLTRLIKSAGVWVNGYTHYNFDQPVERTEYRKGTGTRELYLRGHVDDSEDADNPSETLDPTTSVTVSRRPVIEPSRSWELLTEGEDWERREDVLIFLRMWAWWPREDEFKIVYLDGYVNAPEDIKSVIIELVSGQYSADAANADGTAGITSEKIGDYSYSLGSAAGTSGVPGGGMLTDISWATLNHYQRKLV